MVKKQKKVEPNKEKKKTIESVKAELNKQYNKDVLISANNFHIQRVSTGLLSVDNLFCGGIPKGRWIMIYGAKSSGKTSLVSKIMALVQESGGKAAYIDSEHAYDPDYGAAIGVNNDDLLYSRPDTLEEAETTLMKCVPVVNMVVIDSIVAVGALQETERTMEQDTMAVIPRKLSQFFRVTTPIVGKSKAIVILINQTRTDLSAFIPFDKFPGGNALAHYCSAILQVRRGSPKDDPKERVDGKDVSVGNRIYCRMEKTKIGNNEAATGFFDILRKPPHFDEVTDLLFMAEMKGLVTNAGAWFYYGEEKFQGRDGVLKALRENDKFFEELKKKVTE